MLIDFIYLDRIDVKMKKGDAVTTSPFSFLYF